MAIDQMSVLGWLGGKMQTDDPSTSTFWAIFFAKHSARFSGEQKTSKSVRGIQEGCLENDEREG